jgi:hypothetical protein
LNNADGRSSSGQKRRVSRRLVGDEQVSRLVAASLEVLFYYKNGQFLTEKGQNLTFLCIFLHAIIGQLSIIINHLRAK